MDARFAHILAELSDLKLMGSRDAEIQYSRTAIYIVKFKFIRLVVNINN
jgi:hypothetical protein